MSIKISFSRTTSYNALLCFVRVQNWLIETFCCENYLAQPTRTPLSSRKDLKTRVRRMHFSVPAWLACNLSTMRKEELSSISYFPFGHLDYSLQHTFAGQELKHQVRETVEWFYVVGWCRWWLGVSAPIPWLYQVLCIRCIRLYRLYNTCTLFPIHWGYLRDAVWFTNILGVLSAEY